jgi:trans-aconitate methyltransferase
MSDWNERDSEVYRAIADVAVPRRGEMMEALLAAVPFDAPAAIRIVELGAGEGLLSEALLDRFPSSSLVALDGSESMRAQATARLARFSNRVRVRPFDVAALDWWDVMFGADLVVSALCLHHLNDAKKQYLYKACADRMSASGALLIADLVEPSHVATLPSAADSWDAAARDAADRAGRPDLYERFIAERWNHFRYPDESDRPSALFHHLIWLKHAGFTDVDCVWLFAGHAVFGGFKRDSAAASGSRPRAGN